ncbi:hypothetical protein T4B_178 [Trichinella pseudospiralis]|uniref:Uncharacterized protein n=1 Tax=Trichinella pseudospiralis TaxID=6337 RepID=A0A0V1JJF3_TRIPS|nr:hypothetical protein T4A_10043 [Trichinella pseudospiralis]KRZ35071.1 hypothetical protein T4B_178 [Trichinella pseudospiralis]KRZ44037.1 hypothetical protein T4C_2306 [Trichinella pseudospiralis]
MSRRYIRPPVFPYPPTNGGHIRQEAFVRNTGFHGRAFGPYPPLLRGPLATGRPDDSSFQGSIYFHNDFHNRSFDPNLANGSSDYLHYEPPEFNYYHHHVQLRQQGRRSHQWISYNRSGDRQNEFFDDSMFENPWEDLERQWNTKQLQYESQSEKSDSDDPRKKIWSEVQKIIERCQK